MAFNYKLGKTIQDVLLNFSIPKERRDKIESLLLNEGYTQKGVAYAAVRVEDKLTKFIDDSRFDSIFINEVHKYALKPNDPRWRDNRRGRRSLEIRI